MRSVHPLPRLPKLLLLGTVELGLVPLRPAARLLGGLLLVVGAIGIPAWLIQLAISLVGGGNGGGPLAPGAMILVLAAAIPAGISALWIASIPGPLRRASQADAYVDTDYAYNDDESDGSDAGCEGPSPSDPDVGTGEEALAWAYEALELDLGASPSEVKAAYRRLAQLHHPDHNAGFAQQAGAQLAYINVAYEALLRDLRGAGAGAARGDKANVRL